MAYGNEGVICPDYIDHAGIDPLFDVLLFEEDGKAHIQIAQYCWAMSHVSEICILVSTFSYETGHYTVSKQIVVPIDEWDYN